MQIRPSNAADVAAMTAIVNAAAEAYRGVIPDERWRRPYMPREELQREIASGVVFWVAEDPARLLGLMGIQDRGDVSLIRHAYVSPAAQRRGVGSGLLRHFMATADKPVLIGTWAAASWAIDFYRGNGFSVVPEAATKVLLRRYWSIPEPQVEASVVLADARWRDSSSARSVQGTVA